MKKGFTTFLSALKANTPPSGKRCSSRKFLSLFLILFLAVGNAWGQEITHTNPATITVANRVFLDLQGTPSNVTVGTDNYSNYGPGYFIQNKTTLSWWSFSGTFKSSSSSYSNASNAVGFQSPGSSSASEFYQKLQMREGSDRMTQMDFYVKGTTSVGFQWKNGGTSNKYLTFTIYEMNVTGTTATDESTPVAIVTGNTASSSVQYAATEILDGSKYYHIQVTPKGTSNIDLYGLTFKHAQETANLTWNFNGGSCSGTAGTDYTAAGAVAIGGEIKYPDDATMSKDGYNFNGWDSDVIEMPTTDLTITAQWVSASATESAITYADTKGADVTALPTTYYEGTGVASFGPIADVTDYHFVGWEPASISTEATGDQTITAQWVSAYNIEFNAGTGIGEVPATFQKWEGATFELPAQGALVAPTGKEFVGWSDGTTTYAAGDTYIMGAAAVTFTAQWKAAPTVIFHYQWTGSSTQPAVGDVLTGIGGTITVERKEGSTKTLSNESAKFVSSVPSDMKFTTSDSKGVKFGTSDVWFRIALNSGNFEEGDMIAICGYEAFLISSSTAFDGDISSSLSTGEDKEKYEVKQCVIPSIESFPNLYIRRVASTCGFAAIKVIRPAQKEILSTDITLSAVAVNTELVSAENIATLKADPYKLDLTSEFVEAPTIAFTKQTVITYEDATTKTKTENKEVVATKVDGKWQAQAEINGVTYTVTAMVPAAYTVIYKDGGTELASESVKVGEHPTAEGVESKPFYTLSWKLDEEVVELSNVNGTADQEIILTAVWKPKYATSLDFAAITTAGTTEDNPIVDFLASGNMIASNLGSSEWETSTSKSGYVGYKLKNTGATITFLAQEDKRVTITFGSIAADVTLKKGEESVTISAASGDNAETVYNLDVTTDMVVAITTSSGSTVTLKSITIGEIPTISDDATLKDLKVDGTTIEGFNSATDRYYIEMPYGTQKADLPLVTATAYHEKATVIVQNAKDRDDTRATIKVTAEDGTEKYYYVYFTIALKQGVNLVKATIGDESIALVTNESYIKSAIVQNSGVNGRDDGVSAGSKFQKNSYIKIEMPAGQQFKANDIVDLEVTGIGGTYKLLVYSENSTAEDKLVVDEATAPTLVVGHNKVQLNKDAQALYLVRDGSNKWNPHVKSIIIQRYIAPFIESFVIGEAVGTIDQTNETIAIEVSASADVTALTPTIVAWANGGATVTPTGAQDFTSPVTYKVSSAYAEDGTTEYTVTVTKAAASADATLKTLTINGNALTLVDGVYEYDYELPYGTTTAPVVVAEANDANVKAKETSVSLTEAIITVTAENGATQEYVINFTISPWQNIVIWDGSTMDAVAASPDASGLTWEVNGFKSIDDYTTTCGSKTYSNVLPSGGSASDSRNFKIVIPDGYLAKFYIAFASHEEGTSRGMSIGTTINKNSDTSIYGAECSTRSEALGGTSVMVGAGTYYINPIASIDFCEVSVLLRPGYIRPGLTVGSLGTICLPSNVPAGHAFGVTFYELVGKEPQYGKIVFDEILSGELAAGVPYLFQAQSDVLYCFYGTTIVSDPINTGAMKGTFVDTTLTDLTNIYYFAQKALWSCVDLTSLSVPANRAYVDMDDMPAITESNPAPGVRRITLGVNGQQVATGVDQVQGDEVPTKMIINGQLFILRGEKMYDAQGKLVR